MSWVLPGLALGGLDVASDISLLLDKGVTHIVQLGWQEADRVFPAEMSYLPVPAFASHNPMAFASSVIQFIATAIYRGGRKADMSLRRSSGGGGVVGSGSAPHGLAMISGPLDMAPLAGCFSAAYLMVAHKL